MKTKVFASISLTMGLIGVIIAMPAQAADFKNGAAVAAAMERHYNAPSYRSRIAKAGANLSGRVLCAYDDVYSVECTGRLTYHGKRVKGHWELVKRTARRAKLTWTFTGQGVFEYDSEIVPPSAFGLIAF